MTWSAVTHIFMYSYLFNSAQGDSNGPSSASRQLVRCIKGASSGLHNRFKDVLMLIKGASNRGELLAN